MIICGHRGLASVAPENTLAGLMAAHAAGLDWVEIDVQLSQDKQVVLFHDEQLSRCTDGQGTLRQHTWPQLKTLDAGRWFNDDFANERMCLLSDYLRQACELNIKVNIELKLYPKDCVLELCQQVSQVLEALFSQGRITADQLLFSSFEPAALSQMQQLVPEVPRALLVERIPVDWLAQLQQLDCEALHCQHNALMPTLALAIIDAGYRVSCYTVNKQSRANQLASLGVHMIFSDKSLKQAPS
ncbi:glycerophosphodiester phosphodiesterase family protein [Oceanisphaera sp. IT1-181]|uniref:glycerophosphodiester phosphodiesterase family protein n=1 Tax=Oceanisphaera sp. IT1-181 TaxID=3081199 RepID=UPI0029CAA3D8|nr:glycerophosphodiester phosphodiesterase family protein [Oceanisphaera sp. IT1-181]